MAQLGHAEHYSRPCSALKRSLLSGKVLQTPEIRSFMNLAAALDPGPAPHPRTPSTVEDSCHEQICVSGVAGPVGSGKSLVEALCRRPCGSGCSWQWSHDIYTQEDAQFLTALCALSRADPGGGTGAAPTPGHPGRLLRSTGRGPKSSNSQFRRCWIWWLVKSGGDNLAASLQPRTGGSLHLW